MLGSLLGLGGSIIGKIFDNNAADDQAKLQKEFAQNSIQWKVADATKAGLHPLAALGANTMSYSPQQVGGMAETLGNAGQNIGRAISATTNGTERMTGQMAALQLERAGLENDLLRSQISQINLNPPMPTDGGAGQLIPGQAQTQELVLAGGDKIKLPPGMTADSGQKNEDALGDTGGEALNAYNTWKTGKYNPAVLAKIAAELGYSLTPYGAARQYLPTAEQMLRGLLQYKNKSRGYSGRVR